MKNNIHGTFHRRQLPSPAVAFGCQHGQRLFRESLESGYMNAYFMLAEHYCTQGKPQNRSLEPPC
jgi:hypothetical protein